MARPYMHRRGPAQFHRPVTAKDYIKLVVVLILFFGGIVGLYKLLVVNKDPVPAQKVWEIMEAHGYEPRDVTEEYYSMDPGFKQTLDRAISFDSGEDMRFIYFVFKDIAGASDLYGQAYAKITLQYDANHKIETSYRAGNYNIYLLDSLGKFNAAIWVENTTVYAYCDSENKGDIISILDEMNYAKGETLLSKQ